ncbi:ArsR family transcriptional regulator [Parabacteroides goldsteinii]|uniref:ArsR family transcriptional regulator n=1 Tax=Parabacteroides goldsteinii TaxID=328812 RepID=UPI000E8D0F3E|nr:ArsR family transcriptional regulator [Parabacteroides goldsteinii]HBA30563.1 ArsR family transcriptional regulator [Parabacteroides goldsteinii]
MEERIIVARGNVSRIARMKNCSREMVSHSLAFRKNTRLARSIRKLALELGGIKVGGTDKEETGNER